MYQIILVILVVVLFRLFILFMKNGGSDSNLEWEASIGIHDEKSSHEGAD